ncbi:MAG TPA: ABC transporter substrate-binding protein [Kutzneria sp.]|nr:ABC transporter substrate-binding protein [Kutzneria sp.]
MAQPTGRRPGWGRGVVAMAATALAAPLVAACGGGAGGGVTLTVYYPPEQHFQNVIDQCNDQAGGAYRIVNLTAPRDADGQREQMVRRLAARDPSLDILGLDVTWTSEFAGAGWIEPWTGENETEARNDVLAGPLASATYDGKLYGATKNTNVQLLWYRGDLVSTPPSTWDEMIADAQQLKQQGKKYKVGFTGAQYEGLVVGFNTLTASAGGTLVSDDGTKAVVDDGAVQALAMLKKFATAGVTDAGLASAQEQQIALLMENGDAAFELNWPYVYAAMQQDKPDLFKNFKWTRYPSLTPGGQARVTIGGENLAISAYSLHKDEAFKAALCLRSPQMQDYSAVNDGVPPTIASVYDAPDMAKAYPMKDDIKAELATAASRPITPAYQNVSTIMQNLLSPPSAIDPKATADKMRQAIQDALDSKGVLP